MVRDSGLVARARSGALGRARGDGVEWNGMEWNGMEWR